MKRIVALSVAIVLSLCHTVVAQDRPDTNAQRRELVFVGTQMAFDMLRAPTVVAELKLTAAQSAAILAAAETHDRLNAAIGTAQEGPDFESKARTMQKWEAKEGREALERNLQPAQILRLSEIMCQRVGIGIFDEEAEYLGLASEQQREIRPILEANFKNHSDLIKRAGFDKPQVVNDEVRRKERALNAEVRKAEADSIEQILKKLSQAQVEKYCELLGKPFDTSTIESERRP